MNRPATIIGQITNADHLAFIEQWRTEYFGDAPEEEKITKEEAPITQNVSEKPPPKEKKKGCGCTRKIGER